MAKLTSREKRFPRTACLWLTLLSAVLPLTGCLPGGGSNGPDSATETGASSGEPTRFVYLCEDLSLTKYQNIARGILARCEELDVSCNIVDGKGRSEMLMSYIEDLGQASVDALLVSALTEPLGPLILSECSALEIPIFTVSSRLKDGEGQEIPGIELQGYEDGRRVASGVAAAILEEGALDPEKPILAIMCKMSNLTMATEVVCGFFDEFSRRLPQLGSDSYVQLEVISASAEGQYLSINNYFGRGGAETQYVILSFNDDGSAGIARYIGESRLEPERLLFCSVGAQENSLRIFEGGPPLAERYYSVSADYSGMGRRAVDYMYAHFKEGDPLPYVFMAPGDLVTAENYREYLGMQDW